MKRFTCRTIGAWGVALVALACLAPGLSGQDAGSIAGRVTEEGSLRPLSSAQVFIEGTGIGTFSNASGDFVLLNVPAGEQTVTVRLVGYREASEAVTVTAGSTATLDFALNVTAVQMDEIVVTGTGVATEKRRLGHTIATLDAAELENAPISDFSQLIAGREPGVVALPSSGYTGEGARIRIRGSASLSQLNEPIVYVDGIRVDRSAVQNFNGQGNPSRLDDIPPESIERVEILKGAAAATLYGTEASNGVIQIFTKRGTIGTPRFTFRGDLTGISVPTNRILPVADFAGRVCSSPGCTGDGDAERLSDAVNLMSSRWGQPVSPWEPIERDLIPDLLTTGFGQTYSGSLQGGSSVFQYFASARLASEDGPYDASRNFEAVEGLDPENDTNRRASIHTNFTLIPSSDLRIGVTTLYSDMEHHTPDNSNNIYGVFSSALMSQLRLANDNPELGQINFYGQPAFATLRENAYQLNFVNSQHFAGSTNIDFSPSEAFNINGTFGIDFTSDDAVSFRPYRWNVDGFSGSTPDGSRNVQENRSRELTADIKGSYVFSTSRLENTLLFGGQGFLRQSQSAGGSGRDFPGPGLETLSALGSESSFENWLRVTQIGGYVQDQVGWDNWIFLTVGARLDANSAFGEAFNTALYPKANFAIVPSERWDSELFSSLRIKGAYGTSGLQPGAFDKFTTFSSLGTEVGPGVQPSNLGNDQLKPEVSTELEFGIDLGLFNDRWSVEATYWDRVVTDAMVARQFPVTGGFTQTQLDNIGEVTAHGVEFGIRGNLIQARDISLNVFANTAFLSEKITDMGGAPPLKTGGSYPRYRNYLVEGFTPGAFFGAKGRRCGDPAEHPRSGRRPVRGADARSGARVLQSAAQSQQLQAACDRQRGLRSAQRRAGVAQLRGRIARYAPRQPDPGLRGLLRLRPRVPGQLPVDDAHGVQVRSPGAGSVGHVPARQQLHRAQHAALGRAVRHDAEPRLVGRGAARCGGRLGPRSRGALPDERHERDLRRRLDSVARAVAQLPGAGHVRPALGLLGRYGEHGRAQPAALHAGRLPRHGPGGQRPRALQRRPQLQLPEFDGRLGHSGAAALHDVRARHFLDPSGGTIP